MQSTVELEDLSTFTKPDENLVLIMKDGKIYKNLLDPKMGTASR